MRVQVFGQQADLTATAEVTRDGGAVRLRVQLEEPLPEEPGWYTARLREPVAVEAGETVQVELPRGDVGFEWTAESAMRIDAVTGYPVGIADSHQQPSPWWAPRL